MTVKWSMSWLVIHHYFVRYLIFNDYIQWTEHTNMVETSNDDYIPHLETSAAIMVEYSLPPRYLLKVSTFPGDGEHLQWNHIRKNTYLNMRYFRGLDSQFLLWLKTTIFGLDSKPSTTFLLGTPPYLSHQNQFRILVGAWPKNMLLMFQEPRQRARYVHVTFF